ncbi:putative fucosyltransferase R654 [Phytophthora ramorum]|uniref:putative fucosyltransferase R654 n=1 Tax=Phytophthora ramorum TaxID=164328 RepID=UPI0030A57097|nr:putative fucosyltransferase R654 [Phytophthora ramorum]
MGITSMERYVAYYTGKRVCIEFQDVVTKCNSVLHPDIIFHDLPEGHHTARAFVTDDGGVERQHLTSPTWFSIVSEEEYDVHAANVVEQSRASLHLPRDVNLLEWMEERHEKLSDNGNSANTSIILHADGTEPVLVIGIKTAVVTNFARRQAIRDTWAQDARKYGAKVVFLGCNPNMRGVHDESEQRYLQDAVNMEKKVYGDLLTDELECEDSYGLLAEKVVAFFHLAAAEFAQTPYMMIADDDIYLRVDKLIQLLQQKGRRKRMYMGQAWGSSFTRISSPVRQESHQNYLPKHQYPMNKLLPYAFGPHYVISMDCARFLSRNHWRLRSLNGLEDVSVGLWLLVMQVHLENTQQFSHLTLQPCRDNLISFAELSPLGVRIIHANLLGGKAFCHDFDRLTWNHYKSPSQLEMTSAIPIPSHELHQLQVDVHTRIVSSGHLQVTTTLSAPTNAGVEISYISSVNTFPSYLLSLFLEAKQHLPFTVVNASYFDFATTVQPKIQDCYHQLKQERPIDLSRGELWRHNLFQADPAKSALVVAYAPSASYSHVVLECLFASVFEAQMRPMLVIPANLLEKYLGISPDVFVFSPLGGKCNPAGAPACQKMVAEYFERYSAGTAKSVDSSSRNKSGATKPDRTTQLVMLSGEAWSTDGLDERVLLISTLANANRTKHIHLSMASASFAERLDHGPLSLLSPSDTKTESPKTKFCAYLYAHCDRSDRELMYDALNALRPVDALGKCAGSSRPPDQTKMASRLAIFYNDDAVRRYAPYKFVLAFENTRAAGYVTEKLVNAFLAGSVPVYWGDSKTVSELFNPESFIDCGRFDSLQDCAEYVVRVDDSPEMYTRMRREAPVANMTAFNEAFSWHPTVPSRFMADAVLRHFHN